METHSHTAIDKDYIDHAIKFMECQALGDNDPVLERLNLEIIQVKLPHGFLFCRFLFRNKKYICAVAAVFWSCYCISKYPKEFFNASVLPPRCKGK